MTRDDIIRMAREAGKVRPGVEYMPLEVFERFAKLVAAAEREKVAHWMMTACYATGHGDTTEDLLRELAWQADERIVKAVAAEREACAALCDAEAERVRDLHDRLDDGCIDALLGKELSARSLAFSIRERGAP